MILIALGANLPSRYGSPVQTLVAARAALIAHDINIVKSSQIWLSAPVPFDPEQDWYHNAVISVETSLLPHELLAIMLNIEGDFGRVRSIKNAPRLLDLDLIAYNAEIINDKNELIIPHPRISERLFVLKPIEDISKEWTHPVSGQSIAKMLQNLPAGQEANPLDLSDLCKGGEPW